MTSIISEKIGQLSEIRRAWAGLNSNLENMYAPSNYPFEVPGRMVEVAPEKICRIDIDTQKIQEIDEVGCSFLTIADKFNFTYDAYPGADAQFRVDSGSLAAGEEEWVHQSSWLPFGATNFKYRFITIVRDTSQLQTETRVEGIVKPFGRSTWYMVTIASLVISMVLIFTASSSQNLASRRITTVLLVYLKIWLSLMSLLLDKGGRAETVTKINKLHIMALWYMWSMLVLLMSQTYQAEMFSSLSNQIEPTVPTDLDELVGGGMVGTISSCTNMTNGLPVSCLHLADIPNILSHFEMEKAAIFKKMKESVHWFSDKLRDFVFQAVGSGTATVNKRVCVQLPNQYSIIAQEHTIAQLIMTLDQYDSSLYWISESRSVPMLGSSGFIMMRPGNYFSPMFSGTLGRIIEAGLYARWEDRKVAEDKVLIGVFIFS